MSSGLLESVLRREREIVLFALAALTAVAWAYLFWFAGTMNKARHSPDIAGMDMPGMAMAAIAPWTAIDFVLMFLMWAVMMVGMMTPSVAPMVLIYAGVARQAEQRGKVFPSTSWFFGGYLTAWVAFAALATSAQWALERLVLLGPMMELSSASIGGAILIAAGFYQWTPIKDTCLAQCQAPLLFIQRHGGFRSDSAGAFKLGARHGFYCLGCCWTLMALLFVAGIMNLLWIAALTIIVFLEKLLPYGRVLSRAVGVVLVATGAWIIAAQF